MSESRDSLMPMMSTLYSFRRRILFITLAAFVLSVVFSLFMKNYYQGKTIFYASSHDLIKPEKIFGAGIQEMYYYGSEKDIDRILSVCNSHEVLYFLIDSFSLWTVYKIKLEAKQARFKMRKALK